MGDAEPASGVGREAPTGARRFSSSRGRNVHEARLADEAQHPVPYPWLFVGTEPGERSPLVARRFPLVG